MSQPDWSRSTASPPRDPRARPSRTRRRRGPWRALVALALIVGLAGAGAVGTNAMGAGDRWERVVARVDRLIAGPVPDRSTRPTVVITPPPAAASAAPSPTATPRATASASTATPRPTASPTAAPTPTPTPRRVAVDVDLLPDAERLFKHQVDKDWCAVAGTQMVLAMHGKGSTTDAFQQEIASRIREWESWDDSHNGNWGPAAMALALEAYGVTGYEVRAYDSQAHALADSARAINETGAPVILLTWRGAHTWVMTGFRADADPTVFSDARVSGAYILDPWYPDVSSIWGPSNPPGFFTALPELEENYLPWKRPEGAYPDRDGKFIAVVPTRKVGG